MRAAHFSLNDSIVRQRRVSGRGPRRSNLRVAEGRPGPNRPWWRHGTRRIARPRWRRALSLIPRLARIAQPQAHHQALVLRFGEILESRATVAGLEVVHVLNLPALHDEVKAQRFIGEYLFQSLDRRDGRLVHGL